MRSSLGQPQGLAQILNDALGRVGSDGPGQDGPLTEIRADIMKSEQEPEELLGKVADGPQAPEISPEYEDDSIEGFNGSRTCWK